MPKGQYDRKAAALKKAAKDGKATTSKVALAETPRVKRKYTKRAVKEEFVGMASGNAAKSLSPYGLDGLGEIHGLTNLLGSLSQIAQQATANGGSIPGISGLIKKAAKTLETKFDTLFPAEPEKALTSVGNGHSIQAVTALPVPEKFVIPPPPPAPSNPS